MGRGPRNPSLASSEFFRLHNEGIERNGAAALTDQAQTTAVKYTLRGF